MADRCAGGWHRIKHTFCNSGCACLQLWGRALWTLTKACLDRWLGEGVSPSVRSRTATVQLLQTADELPESVGRQAAAAVAAATTATAHVLSCIVAAQPAAAATGGRPAAEMLVGGMARGRKLGTGKGGGKPKPAAGAAASVDGAHPRQPHSERSGCGNGGGDDAGGVNSGGGGGSERAPPLVDLTTMVGLNLVMKPTLALVAYSRLQELERMNATALAARLGREVELMSAAREGAAAAAGAFADWALPRLAGHAPQLPPSSVSALTELVAAMVRILLRAGNAQRLMAFARAPTHRGGLDTYQRAAAAIEKLLAAGAACTKCAVVTNLHRELLLSLQTAAPGLPPGSVPAFGALCRALEAMLAASAEARGDYAATGPWAETRREILKLAPRRLAPQLEACLAPVGRAAEPPADPAARSAGAAQRPAAGDLAAAAAAAQAAADELLVSASVSGSFCKGFPDRILQVRSISPPRCPHPLAQRAAAGAVCCLEPSGACPHLRGSHVTHLLLRALFLWLQREEEAAAAGGPAAGERSKAARKRARKKAQAGGAAQQAAQAPLPPAVSAAAAADSAAAAAPPSGVSASAAPLGSAGAAAADPGGTLPAALQALSMQSTDGDHATDLAAAAEDWMLCPLSKVRDAGTSEPQTLWICLADHCGCLRNFPGVASDIDR